MLTEEQISDIHRQADLYFSGDTNRRWAAKAIESAATAPLLARIEKQQARINQLVQEVAAGADVEAAQRARIAELETWQAEHWTALEIINNYFVSKDRLLVVEDGGPDAAARNIVHSVVALERELEEARKDANNVFAFRYSSCTHEEGMRVVSLHSTQEAAREALEQHKAVQKAEWASSSLIDLGFTWSDEHGSGSERWDVIEMVVDATIKEQT